TALHERLDAESVRSLMSRYYGALHAAVEAHGGTVVKLLGDGVMAAFGLPRVAEDDAMRAVRAAVAMQQAFRALAREQSGIGLRAVYDAARAAPAARLAVVLGSPGVGKSRLLDEFARRLDGATVLGAHCEAAGGATFAPIAQALRAVLGVGAGSGGYDLRRAI